jgi:hypothetical protein
MQFKINEIRPGIKHVSGATLAEEHMHQVRQSCTDEDDRDRMLLLNFADVLSVTPSYLKATVLSVIPLIRPDAGNAATNDENLGERSIVYPAVTCCNTDVATDINEYFSGRRMPILHITKRRGDRILAAKLFGYLDDVLLKTLLALADKGSATAGDLAQTSNENISINGWNNRLADLYVRRLATRQRKGKFQVYSPVAERITTWA